MANRLMMIALVDIDHTLSNAAVRDHLINPNDWDGYHSASRGDVPIIPMRELVRALYGANWQVILLTTRPEKWRQLTMIWLARHEIKFDELLMRPDDDERSTDDVKMSLFRERFPDLTDCMPVLFDDRESVIKTFREAGITSLHVHAGDIRNEQPEVR